MKIILPWQIARVIFWVEWNSWRTACASRNPPTRTLQMTSSPTSFLIIVIQYNIMMSTFINTNHSRLSTSSVWKDVSMEVSVSLSGHYPRHLCRNICYRSLSKSSIIIIIIIIIITGTMDESASWRTLTTSPFITSIARCNRIMMKITMAMIIRFLKMKNMMIAMIRDTCQGSPSFQKWMNFRKIFEGRGGHFRSQKFCCKVFNIRNDNFFFGGGSFPI